MPQYGYPRLQPRSLMHHFSDFIRAGRPLDGDNQAVRFFAGDPLKKPAADFVQVRLNFRNDDRLGTACYSRRQGDKAAFAAHNFDNKNALVRSGGVAKPVYSIEDGINGSIKSDGAAGARNIIVD